MPKVKPEAKFLIVVISITNTRNKPVGMTPPLVLFEKPTGY
jgi:hypothetical protein